MMGRSGGSPGMVKSGQSLPGGFNYVGSIFSADGPADAADPVAVYNFTRYNSGLTLAQNLVRANVLEDSALNLESVNAPIYSFASALGAGSSYMLDRSWPAAASPEGGALQIYAAHSVKSVGSPAALAIRGALSIEWLGHVPVTANNEGAAFVMFDGGAETEAHNRLYLVQYTHDPSRAFSYQAEKGAGDNLDATLLSSPLDLAVWKHPLHWCFTRDAGGTVRFYINGRAVSNFIVPTIQSGTGVPVPTGGASGVFRLQAQGAGSVVTVVLGVRIFAAELTAEQVQASYRKTWYGGR